MRLGMGIEHPFFFKRAISYALLLLLISLSLFMTDDTFGKTSSFLFIKQFIPQILWAMIFGLSSIGIMMSAFTDRPKTMRIFLVAIISVCTVWTLGFALAFFMGFGISIRSIATYGYIAYQGYLLTIDPLPSAAIKITVGKDGLVTK